MNLNFEEDIKTPIINWDGDRDLSVDDAVACLKESVRARGILASSIIAAFIHSIKNPSGVVSKEDIEGFALEVEDTPSNDDYDGWENPSRFYSVYLPRTLPPDTLDKVIKAVQEVTVSYDNRSFGHNYDPLERRLSFVV